MNNCVSDNLVSTDFAGTWRTGWTRRLFESQRGRTPRRPRLLSRAPTTWSGWSAPTRRRSPAARRTPGARMAPCTSEASVACQSFAWCTFAGCNKHSLLPIFQLPIHYYQFSNYRFMITNFPISFLLQSKKSERADIFSFVKINDITLPNMLPRIVEKCRSADVVEVYQRKLCF